MDKFVIEPITDVEAFVKEMETEHIFAAVLLGFKTIEEMEDYKVDASLGMIKFGGSFTCFLGEALARADTRNTVRLIRAFRDMCDKHADLYKKFVAKQERKENDG